MFGSEGNHNGQVANQPQYDGDAVDHNQDICEYRVKSKFNIFFMPVEFLITLNYPQ